MLVDDREWPTGTAGQEDVPPTPPPTPVDLDLDWVLGKMPRKVREGRRLLPSPSPRSAPHVLCHLYAQRSAAVLTPLWPSVLQEFFLQRSLPLLQPLTLPPGLSVRQALARVLRLPAVASKRYLTNKVLPAPWSTPLHPLSPLHPSLCSPTPGMAVGVHQGGRRVRTEAWSPAAHPPSLMCSG